MLKGDITKLDVETIVNAANSYLTMGGGVAGAIRRAGGQSIENEAIKHAPVSIGKAVATSAGRLKAKFVIHAPTMETPGPTTEENVYKATLATLRLAEELGISSIAFPGFGTGVGGVPEEKAAEKMVNAIRGHLQEACKLRKIVLIDIDDEMVRSFAKALGLSGWSLV